MIITPNARNHAIPYLKEEIAETKLEKINRIKVDS